MSLVQGITTVLCYTKGSVALSSSMAHKIMHAMVIAFACKSLQFAISEKQLSPIRISFHRPIATYKKQGCTKHGVKPHHHGIIHTTDRPPMLLATEPDLGVAPIRLVIKQNLQGIERLAPESRINYSKQVTIEHNSPVFIIGHIHADDLAILEDGADSMWEKRVRDRRKDKKQEWSSSKR